MSLMMKSARGFALLDSLLAMLALAMTLSPLLVLQAQARRDLQQSRQRSRVVLQAAGLAERLRMVPDLGGYGPAFTVPGKDDCQAGLTPLTQSDPLQTGAQELIVSWRDPGQNGAHQLRMLVPR
jgi:type II secretory pathway pseudopilin PulG